MRIIAIFGKGGTLEAEEVVEALELVEDPPRGAKELFPFLVKWDKEHK